LRFFLLYDLAMRTTFSFLLKLSEEAMGHSYINVSLTYLRGLEIAELKEEDMPMV